MKDKLSDSTIRIVISQIEESIKKRYREYWNEKNKSSESLRKIIETFDNFRALINEYEAGHYPEAEEKFQEFEELANTPMNPDDLQHLREVFGLVEDEGQKNESSAPCDNVPMSFPPFPMECFLNTFPDNSEAISCLPYFLTAFYCHTSILDNKIKAKFFQHIISLYDEEGEEYDNLARDIKKFSNLFSFENLIDDICKKSKSRCSFGENQIVNRDSYLLHLTMVHNRLGSKKLEDAVLSPLQQMSVVFALVFSFAVVACISDSDICSRVDFDKSFEFFQAHTKAFSSRFLLTKEDMTFSRNQKFQKRKLYGTEKERKAVMSQETNTDALVLISDNDEEVALAWPVLSNFICCPDLVPTEVLQSRFSEILKQAKVEAPFPIESMDKVPDPVSEEVVPEVYGALAARTVALLCTPYYPPPDSLFPKTFNDLANSNYLKGLIQ